MTAVLSKPSLLPGLVVKDVTRVSCFKVLNDVDSRSKGGFGLVLR